MYIGQVHKHNIPLILAAMTRGNATRVVVVGDVRMAAEPGPARDEARDQSETTFFSFVPNDHVLDREFLRPNATQIS